MFINNVIQDELSGMKKNMAIFILLALTAFGSTAHGAERGYIMAPTSNCKISSGLTADQGATIYMKRFMHVLSFFGRTGQETGSGLSSNKSWLMDKYLRGHIAISQSTGNLRTLSYGWAYNFKLH
jgi:hypothetical protein